MGYIKGGTPFTRGLLLSDTLVLSVVTYPFDEITGK
jgi:hypothetical protein